MRIILARALACSSLLEGAACVEPTAPTEPAVTPARLLSQRISPFDPSASSNSSSAVVDGSIMRPEVASALLLVEASPQAVSNLLDEESLTSDAPGVDWAAEGRDLLHDDKPGDAVVAFRKALAEDASASVWRLLGESYARAGNRARAISCLEEAMRLEPNDRDTRTMLIGLYAHNDDQRARRHAEVLARQHPHDAVAHRQLGTAYLRLSMWAEAIASLERALSLGASSPHVHNLVGYSALQLGRDELALHHLEALLEFSSQRAYMLNNLGLAYERAGRPLDAFAAYLRALELRPGAARATVNRDRIAALLTNEERAAALAIVERLQVPSMPRVPTASTSLATTDGLASALE
ncbi:MAG: tetratricopeptide repeat protein [Myxococcota bacterium]